MPGPGIPTIEWGVFTDKNGIPHVAPAIEKELMNGHTLSLECKCGPRLSKHPKRNVIVHEIVN